MTDTSRLCEETQIAVMSDSELTEEQKLHIESCEECKALLSQINTLKNNLGTLKVPGIEDGQIADAVMQKIKASNYSSKSRFKLTHHLGTAAAIAIILAATIIIKNPSSSDQNTVASDVAQDIHLEEVGNDGESSLTDTLHYLSEILNESGEKDSIPDESNKYDEKDSIPDESNKYDTDSPAVIMKAIHTPQADEVASDESAEQTKEAKEAPYFQSLPEQAETENTNGGTNGSINEVRIKMTSPKVSSAGTSTAVNDTAPEAHVVDDTASAADVSKQSVEEKTQVETQKAPEITSYSAAIPTEEAKAEEAVEAEDIIEEAAPVEQTVTAAATDEEPSHSEEQNTGEALSTDEIPVEDSFEFDFNSINVEDYTTLISDMSGELGERIFEDLEYLSGDDEKYDYNIRITNERIVERFGEEYKLSKEKLITFGITNEVFIEFAPYLTEGLFLSLADSFDVFE